MVRKNLPGQFARPGRQTTWRDVGGGFDRAGRWRDATFRHRPPKIVMLSGGASPWFRFAN